MAHNITPGWMMRYLKHTNVHNWGVVISDRPNLITLKRMTYLENLIQNIDLCPPAQGHTTSIKVCITQFVTETRDILKLSPMTIINLAKTRTGQPLCGESHMTVLVS